MSILSTVQVLKLVIAMRLGQPRASEGPAWVSPRGPDVEFIVGRSVSIYIYISGQIITTSADVTLNGGLIRELPQNPLNSGLGIILICPDIYIYIYLNICLCLLYLTSKKGGPRHTKSCQCDLNQYLAMFWWKLIMTIFLHVPSRVIFLYRMLRFHASERIQVSRLRRLALVFCLENSVGWADWMTQFCGTVL